MNIRDGEAMPDRHRRLIDKTDGDTDTLSRISGLISALHFLCYHAEPLQSIPSPDPNRAREEAAGIMELIGAIRNIIQRRWAELDALEPQTEPPTPIETLARHIAETRLAIQHRVDRKTDLTDAEMDALYGLQCECLAQPARTVRDMALKIHTVRDCFGENPGIQDSILIGDVDRILGPDLETYYPPSIREPFTPDPRALPFIEALKERAAA